MSTDATRQDDLFPWEQVDAPDPSPSSPAQDARAAEAAARLDAEDVGPEHVLGTAGGGTPSPSRPIAPREYYAISEVCDLVGLRPHVLRYWESQFSALNPSKNRSGNRVYQRKEIRLILLVKQLLYDEKYTVEGARAKLERLRRGAELGQAAERVLEPQLIQLLRQDLDELKAILTPRAR